MTLAGLIKGNQIHLKRKKSNQYHPNSYFQANFYLPVSDFIHFKNIFNFILVL